MVMWRTLRHIKNTNYELQLEVKSLDCLDWSELADFLAYVSVSRIDNFIAWCANGDQTKPTLWGTSKNVSPRWSVPKSETYVCRTIHENQQTCRLRPEPLYSEPPLLLLRPIICNHGGGSSGIDCGW
ncbi:hypothetical protein V6N11_074448 [Hibiscus sabdariffa]|uniref:Uncharacterized protein n=1 Tax=Hibiscus sabdariffa TaxID=183260 RepID=A0ABR2R3K0_9ROSI